MSLSEIILPSWKLTLQVRTSLALILSGQQRLARENEMTPVTKTATQQGRESKTPRWALASHPFGWREA